jgi:hypothetical protein
VIAADATVPQEVYLPRPAERQVARSLVERREFNVVDVIRALGPLAQPELLATRGRDARVVASGTGPIETGAVVAPQPTLIADRR